MPRLPSRMRERAEALARGQASWQPPEPRDAATVCLLREAAAGLEVFVLRRTTAMAFAAGMHVYPGGAVEASDDDVPLAGRADLAAVGRRVSSPRPGALLAAAARETFEECGVLLALGPDGAAATPDEGLEHDRAALVTGDVGFAALLARRGLVVDDTAVVPFAHWVTPEVEDRRYDTRFFMAAVPGGQSARHVGGESEVSAWWRPQDALTAYDAGSMAMLPPTRAVMHLLAACDDVATALRRAAAAPVVPLMPAPVLGAAGEVEWRMVDARTRAVLDLGEEPAGSESDGVGPEPV